MSDSTARDFIIDRKIKTRKSAAAKSPAPKGPAHDPEASPEDLAALLDKDDVTNRLLAKHPRASAELLGKLSHSSDKATRQGVAGNPNTAPDVYVKLGQQFPKEFLANPILDLLLMVNPVLMEQVPEALLIRLLKQADCPSALLNWAAGHQKAKVQLAVAMNPQAPEIALGKLRASEHQSVLDAVTALTIVDVNEQSADPEKSFEQAVKNRLNSFSTDELHQAWYCGDIGLAQWVALPFEFRLETSINHEWFRPEGIAKILSSTKWTFETVRRLLPGYRWWDAVLRDPMVPTALLSELANDRDAVVRGSVAGNVSTPVTVLKALAIDPEYWVRLQTAQNIALPMQTLRQLAGDAEEGIRRSVAINIASRGSTLAEVAGDLSHLVNSQGSQNSSTPGAVQEVMATDSLINVRELIAKNTSPASLLMELLAKGADDVTIKALVSDPCLPESVLESLVKDLDEGIREAVARNPSASAKVLESLAFDPADSVVRAVACNPSTPASVLELLSKDVDEGVRQAVAKNPATPAKALALLVSGRADSAVFAAIGNQSTPLLALSRLIKSKSIAVRVALAEHQAHRYAEIFRALRLDSNIEVRLALARNSRIKAELLDELAHSAVSEVEWIALLCNPSLSASGAQIVAERLFTTDASESAWFLDQVSEASGEVYEAATEKQILSYFGKNPDKAVLSKRVLAPLMALCAGSPLQPSRIVKLVGSTDWLIRAAVARHPSTPPNLVKKLAGDAHPLVARLARNRPGF